MPPTLEKLKFGISIRPSICRSVCVCSNLLRYSIEISLKVWIISLCGVMPLLKGHNHIFNQDILKTLTAMSFKLGQVIEDNELMIW